jgi:hypothetical protein
VVLGNEFVASPSWGDLRITLIEHCVEQARDAGPNFGFIALQQLKRPRQLLGSPLSVSIGESASREIRSEHHEDAATERYDIAPDLLCVRKDNRSGCEDDADRNNNEPENRRCSRIGVSRKNQANTCSILLLSRTASGSARGAALLRCRPTVGRPRAASLR